MRSKAYSQQPLGEETEKVGNFLGECLTYFDYSAIEELDPSLVEGLEIVFNREVPIEIRFQDACDGPQEIGTLELGRVKILLRGTGVTACDMKIELTSESNLFLNFEYRMNADLFQKVQERQKLLIEFDEYPEVLIKMFNSCIKDPKSFLAVLVIRPNGHANLDLIQHMEYKFIELLSLDFTQANEDSIRGSITFRYNAIKSKASLLQARLQEISRLVKLKNPALFHILEKSARQQAAAITLNEKTARIKKFFPSDGTFRL